MNLPGRDPPPGSGVLTIARGRLRTPEDGGRLRTHRQAWKHTREVRGGSVLDEHFLRFQGRRRTVDSRHPLHTSPRSGSTSRKPGLRWWWAWFTRRARYVPDRWSGAPDFFRFFLVFFSARLAILSSVEAITLARGVQVDLGRPDRGVSHPAHPLGEGGRRPTRRRRCFPCAADRGRGSHRPASLLASELAPMAWRSCSAAAGRPGRR